MKLLNRLISVLFLALPITVMAGDYPDRPINLIVPYAAGGGTDTAARMLAKKLSPRLGQSIIVENKAGAATQIGTQQVVRAKPDGYTLLMGTANLATNAALYTSLPYDVGTDLTPVAQVTDVPVYLFAYSAGPITDFAALIAAGKKQDAISYATAGVGSIPHLAGEIFKRNAGLALTHVPYKGSSEAVRAVASGEVPVSFDNLAPAYGQVKSGRVKPLAIAAKERSPALPDVPTLAELGYPVEASSWWGVMAPAGTPSTVIQKLNQEIQAVLADPEVRDYFVQQGMHPAGGTPNEFADHISTETGKWKSIVTDANIRIGE